MPESEKPSPPIERFDPMFLGQSRASAESFGTIGSIMTFPRVLSAAEIVELSAYLNGILPHPWYKRLWLRLKRQYRRLRAFLIPEWRKP